ncbi:MAG: putative dsRNA-binding protein [Clostridia bacterium]|nr:putative dsRNA-binding protein [Clostridia bacterium]
MDGLTALQQKLGYTFKDINLLKRAITHSSASHTENNEQLEFLGDSVIQLAVTYKIYLEGGTEGEMTAKRQKLVSRAPLEQVSNSLGLPAMLSYSGSLGSKAISSVYEAVTGAIYCDGGYAAAEEFICRTLLAMHASAPENYKGNLQELVQGKGEPLPVYNTKQCGGEPHLPQFCCELTVSGKTFTSVGTSKAAAEQNAAHTALTYLNK